MRKMFLVALLCAACAGQNVFASPFKIQVRTRDDVALSGVLEVPAARPLKAIALIIQGSGDVDASGDVSGSFIGQPYKHGRGDLSAQLAEVLSKNGVASLRYSKRGKDDPSRLAQQTVDYLISDATDALGILRNLYPKTPLIIIGFSEGALVATHVAQQATVLAAHPIAVEKLILMGLPTQSIDQLLDYQFLEWPVEVALKSAHGAQTITPALVAAREQQYEGLLNAVETNPQYAALKSWLASMRALPPFETIAKSIQIPVYLFHGADDPQVHASVTVMDSHYFPNVKAIHLYPGLGHCFAPLDGPNHDVKTSGPIQDYVLSDVVAAALE